MKLHHPHTLASAICALLAGAPAVSWAAYDCTTTGSSLNVRYNQGVILNTIGQVTITCTRASGDAATNTYSIGINQGDPPAGRQYTRVPGGQTLNYQLFRESTYSTTWNDSTSRVTGTINFGTSLVTSFVVPYYLRIPAQTGKPAGTYDDTLVRFRVRIPQTGGVVGEDFIAFFAVIDPVCTMTLPPSSINLNYPAFSPAPVNGSTNFSVNCTNQTPYTMALSAPNGVIAGIRYELTLSALSANATGLPQTYNISASAPAGQAGTCATSGCSGNQQRTLTITY
jgi:spore coat protein U-like protein